jgi:hypothetical protein
LKGFLLGISPLKLLDLTIINHLIGFQPGCHDARQAKGVISIQENIHPVGIPLLWRNRSNLMIH